MAENILHFGAVTMRVNGTGHLLMTLYSLDKIKSQTLNPFSMNQNTNIEPTRLANFRSQRALIRIETAVIDEFFKINRIILHTKPLWTQYPSGQGA